MNHRNYTYIFILLFALMISSCSRDDEISFIDSTTTVLGSMATETSLTIKVTNDDTNVERAIVRNFSKEKLTDENGIVIINNALRNDVGFTMHIEKDGFLPEALFIPYVEGIGNIYKEVNLTEIQIVDQFNSPNSEQFDLLNFQTELFSNSFIDESGNRIDGEVNLHIAVKPLTGDHSSFHSYLSYDGELNKTIFNPAGILEFYAFDKEGQPLELLDGNSIDFRLILDNAKMDELNLGVELGYHDDVSGLILQGEALSFDGTYLSGSLTRLGTIYIGNHKTTSRIEMDLVASDETPLSYIPVIVKSGGINFNTFSDSNGRLTFDVANNNDLSFVIGSNEDTRELTLDAITEDTDINEVSLEIEAKRFEGILVDCNLVPVMEGYILGNGRVIGTTNEDGVVTGVILNFIESASFDLIATDVGSGLSIHLNSGIQGASEDFLLGTIMICGGSFTMVDLKGFVRFDEDDDGIAASIAELPVIIDKTLNLYNPDGNLVGSTVIDQNGNFNFGAFPLDNEFQIELTYVDTVDPSGYWMYTAAYIELSRRPSNPKASFVNIRNQETIFGTPINIARNKAGRISGTVLQDYTQNGIGDESLANIRMNLFKDVNGNGNNLEFIDSVFTDSEGNYSFENLPNRHYMVQFGAIGVPGLQLFMESDESPDPFDDVDTVVNGMIPVFLQAGEDDADNNFLIQVQMIDPDVGGVSGSVFIDVGGNLIPYRGEILEIYERGPDNEALGGIAIDTAVSNSDGVFEFDLLLPGEYVIVSTGVFLDDMGFFQSFERVLDKDISPEFGEPEDIGDADGLIVVDVQSNMIDIDNNVIVKFN